MAARPRSPRRTRRLVRSTADALAIALPALLVLLAAVLAWAIRASLRPVTSAHLEGAGDTVHASIGVVRMEQVRTNVITNVCQAGAHGGRISATNDASRVGARVRIHLPLRNRL